MTENVSLNSLQKNLAEELSVPLARLPFINLPSDHPFSKHMSIYRDGVSGKITVVINTVVAKTEC
jgi:hypothetical protein